MNGRGRERTDVGGDNRGVSIDGVKRQRFASEYRHAA
jgi:hypothetical protein